MIKKPSRATVWSEDVRAVLPYHRDVRGPAVVQEGPRFAVRGTGDAGPVLGPRTHGEVKGRAADRHRRTVGFDGDDLDGDDRRRSAAPPPGLVAQPAARPGRILAERTGRNAGCGRVGRVGLPA